MIKIINSKNEKIQLGELFFVRPALLCAEGIY